MQIKPQREVIKGFFVIEGTDGAGKSSTLKEAVRRIDAIFPKARQASKEPTRRPPAGVSEEWFLDDRVQHLRWVRSVTDAGGEVWCDRYQPSTMVYQRSEWPSDIPFPEITFILIPTPQVVIRNLGSRNRPADENDRPGLAISRTPDYLRIGQWMWANGARVEPIMVHEDRSLREVVEIIIDKYCE